jgi:spore coat protein CotH
MKSIKQIIQFFLITVSLFVIHLRLNAQNAVFPNNGTLFDDKIHKLELWMNPSEFEEMVKTENLWTNQRYLVMLVYDGKDTLRNCDIRLKGNTSRTSQRKSFRIDTDKRISSQTFQGLKTLNIHGNHNDPSMMREYLSAYTMKKMGVPHARINHVQLYVNGEYLGVRGLVEFIDKTFLNTRFNEKSGNLYKCTWPADLGYKGEDQQTYKDMINPSPENERAYDLKTNETQDDYTRLVKLISKIDKLSATEFKDSIHFWLDVEGYLKSLAAEILIGHWDNYFANKNNYYLYDHSKDVKFKYIPYDMDNTFGVQWGFSNINKRDIHNWGDKSKSAAPLTYALLEHSEFQKQLESYVYGAINDFFNEEHMFPIIDSLANRLDYWIKTDKHFSGVWTSDYGFSYDDWKKSITQGLGNHATYGVKPYISDRVSSAKQQFKFTHSNGNLGYMSFRIFPNPVENLLFISVSKGFMENSGNSDAGSYDLLQTNVAIRIVDILGRVLGDVEAVELNRGAIDVSSLSNGTYFLQIGGSNMVRFQVQK